MAIMVLWQGDDQGENRLGFENEPLVIENIKPFHKIKIPTTTPSEFLSNLVIFGKNV